MKNSKLQEAFNLLNSNNEKGDFDGPKTDNLIKLAERALGVSFPPSYKEFIKKYGCGDIEGLEVYGLTNNMNFEEATVPHCVGVTLDLRKDSLPLSLIAIASGGDGSYYAIDTSKKTEDQECPIVIWGSWYDKTEKVANDFGEFLLESLENILE